MRKAAFVALALGLLVVSVMACRQADPLSARSEPIAARVSAVAAPTPQNALDKAESVEGRIQVQRKLIRNGSGRLEVDSVEATLAAVRGLAQSLGGYVGSESQTTDTARGPRASITCRVPAEKLDSLIGRLKSVGRLRDLSITADDITEQYFDLEVRIRNGKRLEVRLVELLGRASNNLGDLFNVERELARVRGDLDLLEGKQRFWDNQVAFSTFSVEIEGPRPALAADEGGIWATLANAFKQAGENFVSAIAGLLAATGWLVPVAAALALAFWLLRRLWRLLRRRSAKP